MTVSHYLPQVKASKNTYHNLDEFAIKEFQKLYNYLVKHKDKEVYSVATQLELNRIEPTSSNYLNKYRMMKVISTNIKH